MPPKTYGPQGRCKVCPSALARAGVVDDNLEEWTPLGLLDLREQPSEPVDWSASPVCRRDRPSSALESVHISEGRALPSFDSPSQSSSTPHRWTHTRSLPRLPGSPAIYHDLDRPLLTFLPKGCSVGCGRIEVKLIYGLNFSF